MATTFLWLWLRSFTQVLLLWSEEISFNRASADHISSSALSSPHQAFSQLLRNCSVLTLMVSSVTTLIFQSRLPVHQMLMSLSLKREFQYRFMPPFPIHCEPLVDLQLHFLSYRRHVTETCHWAVIWPPQHSFSFSQFIWRGTLCRAKMNVSPTFMKIQHILGCGVCVFIDTVITARHKQSFCVFNEDIIILPPLPHYNKTLSWI